MEKLKRPVFTLSFQCMISLFFIGLALLNAPALSFPSANLSKPIYTLRKPVQLSSSVHQQTAPSQKELLKLGAKTIAQTYMQALLDQQYSEMWSMLHPHIHEKWPNEIAFASFLHNRFKEYTLQGYKLGIIQDLSYWMDPESMISYIQLKKVLVSLQLTPRVTSYQSSPPSPQDLHRGQLFTNLPVIMQYARDEDNKGYNWFILNGGPADLEAPIIRPIAPTHRIVQVPILMYHHVTSFFSTNSLSDYIRTWVIPPDIFSLQMDYLALHHYHTITFNQLFGALYYGAPLPTKPIILTFDDGDSDHYQFVYPLLLAHHFSGMFYIISGQVGWDGRMTWSQLHEMLSHGMQMGSHTVHHVDLSRLINISEEAVQQELQQSQTTLSNNLGFNVQQFCYPYGDPFNRGDSLQRQKIMNMLANDGYVGATTAFGESGSMQGSTYPFAMIRIPIYGNDWFQGFVAKLPWN